MTAPALKPPQLHSTTSVRANLADAQRLGEGGHHLGRIVRRDHQDKADAHVEDLVHLFRGDLPTLPIFTIIEQRGGISSEEMYEVFNMGIGLVLMVSPADAAEVMAALPEALRIGEIRPDSGRRVELRGL